MKRTLLIGVGLLALSASSAFAQVLPPSGPYVAGDIGYGMMEDFDGTSNVNASDGRPYDWTFSAEENVMGFARLGYRFTPNWRAELEGGYYKGDIEGVLGSGTRAQPIGLCRAGIRRTVAAPQCQGPQGEFRAGHAFFNVIYDFLPESRIQPYVGAGLGYVELHNKVFGQLSGVPAGAAAIQNTSFDDVEGSLGYQGLIGVAYALTDRLTVDLTGRYTAADEFEFGSVTVNAGGPGAFGTITDVGSFEGDYRNASVSLGLRYQFGAFPAAPIPLPVEPAPQPLPPPVGTPPPAPPAYTAREFIVYFPFDQYVLTTEAQGVIQEAAAYAAQGNATSVAVVGHADTSGSQAYNVRLSERRAKAVADALVGLGVQQTALSVDWRGETAPAVATGDGVKEPLNRRTTIGVNF